MILADTSVWVNHFRSGNPHFEKALIDGRILMHPFVLGEIACGNLHHRARVLNGLQLLPAAVSAGNDEALNLIEQHRVFGSGLGWVDIHLLASALLTPCLLWTVDARLRKAAKRLKVEYSILV